MRFAFSSRREATMIDKSRTPRNIFIPVAPVYILIRREYGSHGEDISAADVSCVQTFPFRSLNPLTHPRSVSRTECTGMYCHSFRVFNFFFLLFPFVFSFLPPPSPLTRLLPNEILTWKTARYVLHNLGYFMHTLLPSMRIPHICMRKHEGNYISGTNCHTRRLERHSFIIPSYRAENSLDALLSLSPVHSEIIFLLISPRPCVGMCARAQPFAVSSAVQRYKSMAVILFTKPNFSTAAKNGSRTLGLL